MDHIIWYSRKGRFNGTPCEEEILSEKFTQKNFLSKNRVKVNWELNIRIWKSYLVMCLTLVSNIDKTVKKILI